MDTIFTHIYENNVWGNNKNSNYSGSSGGGSDINYNEKEYIPFLKNFIRENDIKTVVDLGSGDFKCGPLIYSDIDVKYTGYDAYEKVINHNSKEHPDDKYTFIHLDFCNKKEEIVNSDLCILKDVIQHWSLSNITTFLDYITSSKKFKFILITNCCGQTKDNTDIPDGDFRGLCSRFLPLKKYNAIPVLYYNTKEISLIK
jgi:hypothetical protein